MLTRIPGGSWYITCKHIVSGANPQVFVFRKKPLPEDYHLRQLAYAMDQKIDKLGKADYVMVCIDCYRCARSGDDGGLEHGAPYDMRLAQGDISLTQPQESLLT